MKVEADCFSVTRVKGEKLLWSHSIPSGNWKGIDFLRGGARVFVFNSLESKKGSVLIKDPKGRIKAFVFENSDDQKGEEIDPDVPVDIIGEEELLIFSKVKKSMREVLVTLNYDDGQDREDSPQDILEKGPVVTA